MSSLILELQRDALDPSISVLYILRKAGVVASKLNIVEFQQWVELEMNGYSNGPLIPRYRYINGEVKALDPYRGWIPVVSDISDIVDVISEMPLSQPISELEFLIKNKPDLQIGFPSTLQSTLRNLTGSNFRFALHFHASQIGKLMEATRDIVLRWAVDLEKDGILGNGMAFSREEKDVAASINYHIEKFINHVQRGAITMSENHSTNIQPGRDANVGVAGENSGTAIGTQHNYAPGTKLVESAKDIQQLLQQLEQIYPTKTLVEKAVVADEAIKRIEGDPTWRQRTVSAIKAVGVEAFIQLIDHPVANVMRAGVDAWREPK